MTDTFAEPASTESTPSNDTNKAHNHLPSAFIYPSPIKYPTELTTPIRMSSIDHVHEQETSDAPAEQIAVDGSFGSDTDTGGPLKSEAASKDESDTQHHARSNSVKKPITFKAVSVTKSFLAKAGTPTTPAAKTNGDTGKITFHEACNL